MPTKRNAETGAALSRSFQWSNPPHVPSQVNLTWLVWPLWQHCILCTIHCNALCDPRACEQHRPLLQTNLLNLLFWRKVIGLWHQILQWALTSWGAWHPEGLQPCWWCGTMCGKTMIFNLIEEVLKPCESDKEFEHLTPIPRATPETSDNAVEMLLDFFQKRKEASPRKNDNINHFRLSARPSPSSACGRGISFLHLL